MQFQVTFKNMPYSEALTNLTKTKIIHIIQRYVTKPTNVHVIFSVDKGVHSAQCTVSAGDGMSLVSQAQSSFMYATVDQLVMKLDAQLRRKKERMKGHKARPTHEWEQMSKNIGIANSSSAEESIDAENILHFERARQRYYQERFAERRQA